MYHFCRILIHYYDYSRRLNKTGHPEGSGSFSVAYPLVISNISISLMVFVDRLFLSWSSAEVFALCLPEFWGLQQQLFWDCVNTQHLCGIHGADRARMSAGQSGKWLAFICGVVSLPFIPQILIFRSGHAPEIIALEEI